MTDNTLRTAIARAIAEGFGEDYDQAVMFRQMNFVGAADAVLKVLAEPGEDVIERVARQLHQNDFDEDLVRHWGEITAGMRAIYRDETRGVLRAAFGGEQDVHLSK